ncbi:MAG TPA: PAS domain S-box protein [Solirubrobacteraceae bacterium]|nr:PAS domain S-box protein [Solirubrobacteraceae bacterium]
MTTHRDTDRERRLFEHVRSPWFVTTADGRPAAANEAALELLGVTEETWLARPFSEVIHPDDRGAVELELAHVLAHGGTTAPSRMRVVRPDGEVRWVEVQSTVDAENGLIYSLVHDVTDRGEAFIDRLASAFRDAPLGMALVDPSGAFLRVNSTLCRLLGHTEEELLAESLSDVVEDDGVAKALRDAAPSLQTEAPMRHRDGRLVVALVSLTLVRDLRAEPEYYVCQVLDMTERYQAQADLAANEAKLAEAQQIARMGSWEWEIAADRVTWSDELYRIYGVTPDGVTGSYGSYLDKVHPDDRGRVGRVIETGLTERRPWSLDSRIVRPDGDLRMIHARGEIVLDENARPAVVHGTCQDVTENHRVEDQLRAAEQLFRRAFDDAPIGMALIDLDGRWLRLNRSLCQMLGRSEQQLRTTELNELSHPEDRRLDRPLIKELLAGRRRSFAIEKRYLRADGTMVHALVHISLMHGDGERPLYFLCQLVDITERRRAEAERKASEDRLQAIIDNSPALILVKDTQHRYLLVNRRWEELFGVRADQAVGRTSEEVLPAARRPAHREIDDRVAENGEPYEAMMVIPEPDGLDERTFLMVKFPLRDVDGDVSAVVTIATDITERRRSAEERAGLEHRLAQAQRLESVGQLAGGVAHDFNNLLSVILTCVGFATRELPVDHPVRDDVEEIGRAADRAAALTRQLLMFSRREVVKPEVLDVGGLLRDLERLLNRTLSERIALRITVGPGLLPVLADRAQLEQVLVNLAVNARDAMPEGGTLAIAVAGLSDGVRITVVDDGTGMAEEVRDRAFEPFFTTKGPGEGTGLGLATVHGIVTDSGGTVEIKSALGKGTSVAIFLPGCREQVRAPEPPAEPGDHAASAARVLVVEDQEPVRRQACRILTAHGYEVTEAPGGEEALAEWGEVDVLVTDVVMPGMTGQQLAQVAMGRNPDLRVVYMSGHTEDVLVRDGARARNLAFVQKPFKRATLLRAVEDALAAAPGGWAELAAER